MQPSTIPTQSTKPVRPQTSGIASTIDPVAYNSDATEIRENELKLNQELGLRLPAGVLTETIPSWQAYFGLLRWAYDKELIVKDDVLYYMQNFAEVPDQNKLDCISLLNNQMEKQLQKNSLTDQIWLQEQSEAEIKEIMDLLPIDLQAQFNEYLNSQEEIPDELSGQAVSDLDGLGQADTVSRLQRALDRRNTLTSKSFQVDNVAPGQALSPAQINQRFDLNNDLDVEQNELPIKINNQSQNPSIKPILPKIPVNNVTVPSQNIIPNSNYQTPLSPTPSVINQVLPSANRNQKDDLDPYAGLSSMDVGSSTLPPVSSANSTSANGVNAPRGLDDLLNK